MLNKRNMLYLYLYITPIYFTHIHTHTRARARARARTHTHTHRERYYKYNNKIYSVLFYCYTNPEFFYTYFVKHMISNEAKKLNR